MKLLRLARVGLYLGIGALVVALVYPCLALPRRRRVKQWWSRRMLASLGVRLDDAAASAVPPDWHGLLICNHVSFIDIFVLNALLPTGFVAKSEVSRWPLLGWMAARAETIFIARGSVRAAHGTQQQLAAALRAGHRLTIFPEGTTSMGSQVLPFHGALFQGAVDANVAVHCLAIAYVGADGRRSEAPAYVGETSLWECVNSVLSAPVLVAKVAAAGTLAPPHDNRRRLAHHAHTAVARSLSTLLGTPPPGEASAPSCPSPLQPDCNERSTSG